MRSSSHSETPVLRTRYSQAEAKDGVRFPLAVGVDIAVNGWTRDSTDQITRSVLGFSWLPENSFDFRVVEVTLSLAVIRALT